MRVVQPLFVFEFANDFFEDVFQGDDAQHFAVFVHHDAQAALLLVKVQQLHLQGGAFRDEVGFVAGAVQLLQGQLCPGQQVADQLGIEDRFNLVDIVVIDRQPGVPADDQLLDDAFDRLVQIDTIDFVARHQDVVDGDFVQRLQTIEQPVAHWLVRFVFVEVVILLWVQGHRRRLRTERAQDQLGATIEQAGQWLEDSQRHLQQAGTQADERLWVTPRQAPRQELGKHQQGQGGAQAGQPETVFAAVALADQAGQAQYQQLAQAGAQHQRLSGQGGLPVVAIAQRAIELQACGIHGAEQRRPQQRQCQGAE
ncbi:hypothetical protein D3C76_1032340 [compost metagenome]